jgi:penicillin-binding protein 1A
VILRPVVVLAVVVLAVVVLAVVVLAVVVLAVVVFGRILMLRVFLFLYAIVVVAGLAAGGAGVHLLVNVTRDLPDHSALATYEPPVVSRLHAGDGRLLAEFASERRIHVPIEAIPKRVSQAFIAAEDQRFYSHFGIDPQGIARAAIANIDRIAQGRRPEGASTITQQVARNFLLNDDLSIVRKLREAVLAVRIDRAMPKDKILELYLNEIFLGGRSYGVAAAALNYFNKSLDALSVAEAAYLAALPKAPSRYPPQRRYDAAVARRNYVIARMAEDGFITPAEAEAARAEPLVTRRRDATEIVANADYFAEEVRRQVVQRYGEDALYKGGLSIRTTLDPVIQDAATKALRTGLIAYDRRHGYRGPVATLADTQGWEQGLAKVPPPPGAAGWSLAVVLDLTAQAAEIGLADGVRGRIPLAELRWARRPVGERLGPAIARPADALARGAVVLVEPLVQDERGQRLAAGTFGLRQIPEVQGGLVAMDPHTGRVLAMVGGFSAEISSFNRATQAWRQPGSSFKPFVYMAALENGFTPSSLVLDAPFAFDPGYGQPVWRPENYTQRFYGPTPLRVGMEQSRNLMTVRLANAIGMDKVVDYATAKFGVMDRLQPFLPMSLGAGETTVLRMTTAYSTMVNGGKKISPTLIDRIQDRKGRTIFRHDARACAGCRDVAWNEDLAVPAVPDTREQVADPRTTYQMVLMLEGVVRRGTAAGTIGRVLARPLAGKTGTTNDYKDAWFVGFSPDLAVGLYVGFDQPKSLGRDETGGGTASPIFRDVMAEALKDAPVIPFRVPPGIRLVRVDPDSGRPAEPGQRNALWDAFLPGTEPNAERVVLDGSVEGQAWLRPDRGPVGPVTSGEGEGMAGTGGLY